MRRVRVCSRSRHVIFGMSFLLATFLLGCGSDPSAPRGGGDDAGQGGHGGHGAVDGGDAAVDGGHGAHAGVDGGHHGAGGAHGNHEPPDPEGAPAGEVIFRNHCAACHTLGRGPTTRAPDLLTADLRPDGWLRRWLTDPQEVVADNPYAQRIVDAWDGKVMPDPDLDAEEIEQVIAFIRAQRAANVPLEPRPLRPLEAEAQTRAESLYFNKCAGCHGILRGGAIGPDLRPDRAAELGSDLLGAVMRHGTPWGMPSWGRNGLLTDDEIADLVAVLNAPVPPMPTLSLEDAQGSWELLVPPADRPAAPQHAADWAGWFGVVQRDTGEVAILDGATRAEVGRVDVGFATHILRASSSGRYFYAVGRDGWITMIDLWTARPTVVARVRGCFDARSVESSKFEGFEDRFVIEGCYAPSQFVVFDGQTLEPLAMQSVVSPSIEGGAPLPEVRVAAIVASSFGPHWVLALKESGYLALVDYSQPGFPVVERLAGARLLHDGGFDHTRRYFISASATGQLVVMDLQERRILATIPTGALPHPGRGANWTDPEFGPVNATVHLGEGLLLVYGTDPEGHPEHAWQVVRRVALPAAGSLFLKTHEASPWVLMDMTMSDDPVRSRQVCAYSKATGAIDRCFSVGDVGRATHIEFDRTGSTFWVSLWHHEGAVVVYDTATLREVDRVEGLDSPTGKFNVHNTAHEIY